MQAVGRTSPLVVDTSQSPYAKLRPLPTTAVTFRDGFWERRRHAVGEVMLLAQYEKLETTGRLANFRRTAAGETGGFEGLYFNDTDVYKWLEAAGWILAIDDDPVLDELVDRVIAEVAAAQQADGYLDNFYTLGGLDKKWTELVRTHELYCAGHLIQAAVAHHRATGKTNLLGIARRFADNICDTLGPAESGKKPGTDGHEEIEMALVELARVTGEQRYFDQAVYFLDARGHGLAGGDEYHQDHQSFRELDEIVGHAVRAVYLNAGAADIYAETGDAAILAALERLWQSMTTRRMYVTGGIGSRYEGEAFGIDYELPNARAYAETCAAIGSVMWNWRMLLLTGDAKYADLMERTLYNAVICGISIDNLTYLYENPLSDDGSKRREAWFYCSCCPPNVARTFASLPGYVATTSDEGIWVHLYGESDITVELPGDRTVRLSQQTRYPWDGRVEITVDGEADFTLYLRIPGWCIHGATLEVNGEPSHEELTPGSYVALERRWKTGDTVRLNLLMSVRLVEAHPHVAENLGKVAVFRGPILYCAEQADNPGIDPRDVAIKPNTVFNAEHMPELLFGVTVLSTTGLVERVEPSWRDQLYRPAGTGAQRTAADTFQLTLIPYFAWGNRAHGPMEVWLRGF
ncbi:MAG: glycoside hydrolase family 127 protein [Thermomicrobiales bacterium]